MAPKQNKQTNKRTKPPIKDKNKKVDDRNARQVKRARKVMSIENKMRVLEMFR